MTPLSQRLIRPTAPAVILGLVAPLAVLHAQAVRSITEPAPPVLSEFRETHGATVAGLFAPYAAEYALQLGLDTARIGEALTLPETSPPEDPWRQIISSERYCCGSWTYFRGPDVQIFEFVRGRDDTGRTYLVVLFNVEPAAAMENDFEHHAASWRLAVLTDDYEPVGTIDLSAAAPPPTGVDEFGQGPSWPWGDMVTTDLSLDGSIRTSVAYAQTGHTPAQPIVEWTLAVTDAGLRVLDSQWR